MADTTLLWTIGAIGSFVAGLGLGLMFGRGDRAVRAEASRLEAEAREAKRQLQEERARIEKHFGQTSELFRDLTSQYTELYAHLAEGAREFCPEGSPALGPGLNDPLLDRSRKSASASGNPLAGLRDDTVEDGGEGAAESEDRGRDESQPG